MTTFERSELKMIEYKRTRKFTLLKKKEKEEGNPQDMRQNEAVTQVETERKQKKSRRNQTSRKKFQGKTGLQKG